MTKINILRILMITCSIQCSLQPACGMNDDKDDTNNTYTTNIEKKRKKIGDENGFKNGNSLDKKQTKKSKNQKDDRKTLLPPTTLLINAISKEDISEVKSLIARGEDLTAMNEHRWTPFHVAAQRKNFKLHEEIFNALKKRDGDNWYKALIKKNNTADTPLHIAAYHGNVFFLHEAINQGLPLRVIGHIAEAKDSPKEVYWLLEQFHKPKRSIQNFSSSDIRILDLRKTEIKSQGIRAIAQNTSWINLQTLILKGNKIDPQEVNALAQNTSWINLKKLDLENCRIGNKGGRALGQNTSWVKLETLILWSNEIGANGAEGLAQNTSWKNLKKLLLGGSCFWSNEICNDGARALSQNISWTNLQELDLGRNSIGDGGVKFLAQNTSWINLQKLDVGGNIWLCTANRMTDEGAKALSENTSWHNLQELDVSYSSITNIGKNALQVRWPNAKLN